jgi:hypothetical protein
LNYGTITFDNLYASIYDVTSIDEFKNEYKEVKVDIISSINSHGKLNFKLRIPYDQEKFYLDAELDTLALENLNPSIMPLVGVEVKSGSIDYLKFKMESNRLNSENYLDVHYRNLGIKIYEEIDKDSVSKKEFVSFIANSMIHTNNNPEHGHYKTTNFSKDRNIYRAPFQHIVVSLMEGFMEIMPTAPAKFFLNFRNKNKTKKK